MTTRHDRRRSLADQVNAHGGPLALKYGIERVGNLTNLDSTGIPVWASARPNARTVTVQSGKSLDPAMARAGALIEGVEYAAAETPHGPYRLSTEAGLSDPHLNFADLPLCHGSLLTPETPIPWETFFHLNERTAWAVPSDLAWMVQRVRSPFFHLQMTTNGLGSGTSVADASLSGLYELIERDAWTLFQYGSDRRGWFPKPVDLSRLEGETREILDRIASSGMRAYLLDVTTELGIPSFRALLYDLSLGNAGSYCGHGCSFDPFTAMNRALLEAAQSRACFTAGARDDLFRHGFLFLRQRDHAADVRFLDGLGFKDPVDRYPVTFGDETDELTAVLKRLERHGFYHVLVKAIAKEPVGDATLHVVRVVAAGLEGHHCEMWTPGRRALGHVA